uniref:Methyltransferase domain-containing protein n=1 Tax=Hemiselmis tepida TaxID=464990 RepID=A0A7S0VX72_9CRYP|mmetsp:Transcript_31898/g.81165  ORF Transcript_31898/g.81165 Transcript_31898/m.81165 type:complete len:232 (+) Transcript_31898:207-902(+)
MSDVEYWNGVYQSGQYVRGKIPTNPTSFARFALPYFQACHSQAASPGTPVVVEWGCGNGRDSLFFAYSGLNVVATDISSTAAAKLRAENHDGLLAVEADFASDSFNPLLSQTSFSSPIIASVYSRFSIHSVSEAGATSAFKWAWKNLAPQGTLAIETRSVKDKLFGVGTPVEGERNAWVEDHYRRFTVASDLRDQLTKIGFDVVFFEENSGFAAFGQEDPICIRAVVAKPE